MIEQEVVDYIIQAQKHGLSDIEIKQNLLNVGWDTQVVDECFAFSKTTENKPNFSPAEISKPTQQMPTELSHMKNQVAGLEKSVTPIATHNLSEQHFQNNSGSKSKKTIFLSIFAVFLLLAGSAYGYYEYFYKLSAEGVLGKALKTSDVSVYKTAYKFGYQFTSNYDASYFSSSESNETKTIQGGLTLEGNQYIDTKEPQNPKLAGSLKININNDNQSFGTGFDYQVNNKIIYIDLSSIPNLANAIGENLKWIKIDFNEIKQYAQENNIDSGNFLNPFDLQKESSPNFFKMLIENKIIKPGALVSKEEINGVKVYHLKNEFDKELFLTHIFKNINKAIEQLPNPQKELTQEQKDIFVNFVNKIEIKKLETWVGQKDYQIYKIHALFSAPSPDDLEGLLEYNSFTPFSSARAKSRDAKRLADIRQMASALELYFNDNSSYPEGLNGIPQNMTPTFIGVIPIAPTPADGKCSDYYNSYWYETTGQPKIQNGKKMYSNYSLTFCLGGDTGGYKAGISKLTAAGIESEILCTSTPENCTKQSLISSETNINNLISKFKMDAEIEFEISFSDFGKTQNLTPPEDAASLIQFIKDSLGSARGKSADAKRLADMRQLASALEFYFSDFNAYPESLDMLAPKYIGVVPSAPELLNGTCNAQSNTYTYKKISKEKYNVNFCLGEATGGYAAGIHSLSETGIH